MVTSAETLTVEIAGGRRIEALVCGPRDGTVLVFHNGPRSAWRRSRRSPILGGVG